MRDTKIHSDKEPEMHDLLRDCLNRDTGPSYSLLYLALPLLLTLHSEERNHPLLHCRVFEAHTVELIANRGPAIAQVMWTAK